MDKVLPILTEGATAARDQQSVAVREAAAALQQAGATLERLEQFRSEFLIRAPGREGRSVDAQALVDYQRFLARLDEAIAIQQHERQRRAVRLDAQQQQLAQLQKRLMAFETLATRRAAVRGAKAARVAQRDADEYAARAARRMREESTT